MLIEEAYNESAFPGTLGASISVPVLRRRR